MHPVLFTILGAALLCLAAFEVYATILRARKRPGPLSTRLNRALWLGMSALSRDWKRQRRHTTLAIVGPLLLPLLGLLLVLCLLSGFSLLYLAHLHQGFAFAGNRGSGPASAFYFSGVTLLTIGYGDITPVSGYLRVLSLVEGLAGIAVLSLATAYLLTVYSAVEQKRAKALTLHHQGGRDTTPAGLVVHTYRRGSFHNLEMTLRSGAADLQVVLESHIEHPVIYYFHSESVKKSLPSMLFFLLEGPTLLLSCLDPQEHEEMVDSPDLGTVLESSQTVLDEVLASLQLKPEPTASGKVEETQRRRERALEDARSAFEGRGIRLRPYADALPRYLAQREIWESKLATLSRFLGYDWQEVSGDA